MAIGMVAGTVLHPTNSKGNREAIGVAHQYAHKTIKVVNYIKQCLAQEVVMVTSHNMQQLAVAPAWARCALPDPYMPDGDMAYLCAATAAKKSASHHLNRAQAHQGLDGVDSLAQYSALGTPKELAQFWRRLNQHAPSIPTLSAMVVQDGVTVTYHNATSVLQVF